MESKKTVERCEDVAAGGTSDGAVKNCDIEKSENGLNNNEVVDKINEEKMEIEKNVPKENVASETPSKEVENTEKEVKSNDENLTSPTKNGVVVIQKPKRTKSRRSLNKIPTMNNINFDVNGNATIYRTDR